MFRTSRKDLILVVGKNFQRQTFQKNWKIRCIKQSLLSILIKNSGRNRRQVSNRRNAYEYPGEDRQDDYIKINSYLDIGFNEQDLNAYLGELKAITIHEIQHGGQTDDMLALPPPKGPLNPLGGTTIK